MIARGLNRLIHATFASGSNALVPLQVRAHSMPNTYAVCIPVCAFHATCGHPRSRAHVDAHSRVRAAMRLMHICLQLAQHVRFSMEFLRRLEFVGANGVVKKSGSLAAHACVRRRWDFPSCFGGRMLGCICAWGRGRDLHSRIGWRMCDCIRVLAGACAIAFAYWLAHARLHSRIGWRMCDCVR